MGGGDPLGKNPGGGAAHPRAAGGIDVAALIAAGPVVLFDGECGLCHRAVRFLLRHERGPVLRFASLQSDMGQRLLAHAGLPADLEAMALVQTGGAPTGADAALALCAYLKAPVRWLRAGRILPAAWRNGLYRAITRRRIRWFGRVDRCALPVAGPSPRFLDGPYTGRPV